MNPSALSRKYYLYSCNTSVKWYNDEAHSTLLLSYVDKKYGGFKYSHHARHETCDLDAALSLLRMHKIHITLEFHTNDVVAYNHWTIEFRRDIEEFSRIYRLLTSIE